jgi:uncharacterized membrane protein
MSAYELLKVAHIASSAVLFGTGAGIAFFMLMAWRTRDVAVFAAVARMVVVADLLFTATAVVAQPITGGMMAARLGLPVTHPWIFASLALYTLAGLFWLPVVWIQSRMAKLAGEAARAGEPLPPAYHRLFRIWFAFGWPAFAAAAAIIWLMIAKPTFGD